MRIGIQRPAHGNEIGTAAREHRLGIFGIDEPAGDEHRNRHRFLDRLRVRRETPARKRRRLDAILGKLRAFVGAAGDVERDDTGRFETAAELDDILLRVTAFGEFARRQPHDEREVGQRVFDSGERLEQQARAIVERAAVRVGPFVDARGEELLEEIAVARVNLHRVVAGLLEPACRGNEELLDLDDLRHGERPHGITRVGVRPRRWPDRLHVEHRAAQQSAAVVQLPADERAVALDRLDDGREPRNEAVVVAAKRVVMGTRGLRHDHRFGHDHAHAAARTLGVVELVALGRKAVGRAVVGAHRRHDHAIANAQRTDAPGPHQQHVRPITRA